MSGVSKRTGRPFAPGNPGGPGNPHAAKMSKCRAAFLEWVDPDKLAKDWIALRRMMAKAHDIIFDEANKVTVCEFLALWKQYQESLAAISDRAMGRPTPYLEISESEEDRMMRFAETLEGADPREIASGILGFLRGERGTNGAATNGNGQH